MTNLTTNTDPISNKIHTIRGLQVMLDKDLAELYGVETKRINEAVRNNQDKSLDDFYFELTDNEFENLRSKFLTANFAKTRTNPKVFTEQSIYIRGFTVMQDSEVDIMVSQNAIPSKQHLGRKQ